jgi:flagellin-like protein
MFLVFEIMIFTKKNDEGISPVIGVILMVAITVILAAVIAAFVFGMAGNISKTRVVAVTVTKQGSSGITLTDDGGQDQGSLNVINATTSPNLPTSCTAPATLIGSNCQLVSPSVGSTLQLVNNANGYAVRTQITVVGTFNDGTNQILLNTFL